MKSLRPQIKARWHAFCWARDVSHPVHSQRSVDVFVVDTPRAAGVAFALAGWNPRVVPEPGDLVLAEPADVLAAAAWAGA